jgi:hypothetical protein
VADLATFDLPRTLRNSEELVARAKALLAAVAKASSLPYQKPFLDILNYMIGELEKCADAANLTQALKLAGATRNLFELSFAVEYVCMSDENMDRFLVDADIDELEIMEKFLGLTNSSRIINRTESRRKGSRP